MNKQQAIMQVRTLGGINILAALWLILAPFSLAYTGALRTSTVLMGIVIGILAIVQLSVPLQYNWINWVNAVLGLWVIISPFSLGYASAAELWNTVVTGIISTGLSIWIATMANSVRTEYRSAA